MKATQKDWKRSRNYITWEPLLNWNFIHIQYSWNITYEILIYKSFPKYIRMKLKQTFLQRIWNYNTNKIFDIPTEILSRWFFIARQRNRRFKKKIKKITAETKSFPKITQLPILKFNKVRNRTAVELLFSPYLQSDIPPSKLREKGIIHHSSSEGKPSLRTFENLFSPSFNKLAIFIPQAETSGGEREILKNGDFY